MFCFLIFCFPTPSAPTVPDGMGGAVPYTNSRVMPDGSLRTYDPVLDGVMMPDGTIAYPYMPAPPPAQGYVDMGPPVTALPRHREPKRIMPEPQPSDTWVDPNQSPAYIDTSPAYDAAPL